MNSIYDKASNDSMIARINKLTPESKALWGKMNAAQMCRHCAIAIDIAFGKGDLKVNFLMKLLGKMLKKKSSMVAKWVKILQLQRSLSLPKI